MEPARLSMRLIGCIALAAAAPLAGGAGEAKLELVATIAMPKVKGRIDHFAVDTRGKRLFVAALGNDTVEVLDIAHNRHQASLPGFGEPQGLVYLPESKLLYVANGSADRVDVFDGDAWTLAKRIAKLDDADNVRFDAKANTVFVGYGKGALRAIGASTGNDAGEIRLAGHPESFQLERGGSRIFVNVPTAHHIAVVDRAKGRVIAQWRISARSNFPMALDESGRRLFVGARSPAVLLVHDIDSGKELARLEIGGDTDDLFYDAARKRVYVICGEGRIDVVRQESAERYAVESSVKTASRARTGLFVPEEGRLYVAAPAVDGMQARVLVYSVR